MNTDKNLIIKVKKGVFVFLKDKKLFFKKIALFLIVIIVLFFAFKIMIKKIIKPQDDYYLGKIENPMLKKKILRYQQKNSILIKKCEKIFEDADIAIEIKTWGNWTVVNKKIIKSSDNQLIELTEELESITYEDGLSQGPEYGTKIVFSRPTGDSDVDGKLILSGLLCYHYE